MSDPISGEIRSFIERFISSVTQLEVLLLLARDSRKSWNPAEVSRELRAGSENIRKILNQLNSDGLLEREESSDRFLFKPESDELAQIVTSIGDVYRTYKTRLIDLIYSRPINNLKQFADAFRLKKEED